MKEEVLVPEPSPAQERVGIAQPQNGANSMQVAIPLDIARHVVALGEAEWGATDPKSALAHGEDTTNSVVITAENFGQEGDQAMHGLYLHGTETVLCHTGTSPNSPLTARAMTGAWNRLLAECRAALADANASERVTTDAEPGTGRLGHK